MKAALERMSIGRDQRISDAVKLEQSRLRNFIRRRVPDARDAEDILQDVFYELVEANRLLMPIEHIAGWMFRVARNRIADLFRKRQPENFSYISVAGDDGELLRFEDLLPSPDAGPEALYARGVLLDELESAIDELPDEQREVFVAHELEGRSFKRMAAETGVNVNTLLSRKRYAVRHLRQRLQTIYDEFIGRGFEDEYCPGRHFQWTGSGAIGRWHSPRYLRRWRRADRNRDLHHLGRFAARVERDRRAGAYSYRAMIPLLFTYSSSSTSRRNGFCWRSSSLLPGRLQAPPTTSRSSD